MCNVSHRGAAHGLRRILCSLLSQRGETYIKVRSRTQSFDNGARLQDAGLYRTVQSLVFADTGDVGRCTTILSFKTGLETLCLLKLELFP